MTTFHFEGLPWPLCIAQTPLREAARRFFALWPHRCSGEEAAAVERTPGGGYVWRQGERTVREATEAAFLCSLSIEMVMACCEQQPDLWRLHAAAVAGYGCGLLLCGSHRAGKSVLTTRLMAEGWTGFGDDMVALTREGLLFSFGIAPRLRLPLPASSALRAYVAACRGCGDRSAVYLDAAHSGTAPWGTKHTAHAVVILRRVPSGPVRLRALGPADGVTALLQRSLFDAGQAGTTLHAACALLERLPCVQLSYADADRAAQFLTAWARQGLPAPTAAPTPHAAESMPSGREDMAGPPSARCWRRRKGPVFRQVGLAGYLTDARGNALYRLTPLGCALWQMLDQPLSEAQAVALLVEAFPQAGRTRIAHDVRALFATLRRRGLIEHFSFEKDETRGGDTAPPGPK